MSTSNFVPAADVVEERRDAPTVGTVLAIWLGNFGAGIGIGVVTAIIVNRAFSFGWEDTAIWGICAGGLAFGILMAVRFSLDEIVEAWEWRRALADLDRLETENATLRDRITSLQQDINLDRLQRYAQAKVPEPTRVDAMPETKAQVVIDAEELLTRHFAGKPWARDAMKKYAGWTTTRWNVARDQLEAVGVAVTTGKQTQIQAQSMTEALAWLNGADSVVADND